MRNLLAILVLLIVAALADAAPYPGWAYKRTLTDSNSTTVTDFVVNVNLSSNNFNFAHVNIDGADIRFYDETDQQQIPWWIESWNSVAQTATIWVKVRAMNHTNSMYYGKTAPGTFRLPPIGPWVKRTTAAIANAQGHLGEGLVIDDDGTPYITSSASAGGAAEIWKGSTTDPWTATYTLQTPIFTIPNANGCLIIQKGSDGYWYAIHGSKPATLLEIYMNKSAALTSGWGSSVKIIPYNLTTWDNFSVDEPYHWQLSDGRWAAVYMANDGVLPHDIETIFYAESATTNAQGTWVLPVQNPVWGFGGDQNNGLWYSGTVADPFRWQVNTNDMEQYVYASVSATYSSRPWNIGYAVTTNFTDLTPKNIMLTHGAQGAFDDIDAHRGSLMLHTDGYYYLIYTGHDGTKYNGGMARMYSLSTSRGYPPEQVFDFYADYSDNLEKDWFVRHGGTGGSTFASGGKLTIWSGPGTAAILQSAQHFHAGYQLEAKVKHASANGTANHATEIGFAMLNGQNGWLGTTLAANNIRIYTYNSSKFIKSTIKNGDSTGSDMAQNYSTNDVIHRIKWVSDTSILYQNDDNLEEEILTDNVPAIDLPVFAMSYGTAGNNSAFDIYYMKVRKYAATEPAIGVGVEQMIDADPEPPPPPPPPPPPINPSTNTWIRGTATFRGFGGSQLRGR